MAPARPPSFGGESINDGASMQMEDFGTKYWGASTDTLTRFETPDVDAEGQDKEPVVARMEDVALKALHVDDNPSLNPWTFRMFVLGQITQSLLG